MGDQEVAHRQAGKQAHAPAAPAVSCVEVVDDHAQGVLCECGIGSAGCCCCIGCAGEHRLHQTSNSIKGVDSQLAQRLHAAVAARGMEVCELWVLGPRWCRKGIKNWIAQKKEQHETTQDTHTHTRKTPSSALDGRAWNSRALPDNTHAFRNQCFLVLALCACNACVRPQPAAAKAWRQR